MRYGNRTGPASVLVSVLTFVIAMTTAQLSHSQDQPNDFKNRAVSQISVDNVAPNPAHRGSPVLISFHLIGSAEADVKLKAVYFDGIEGDVLATGPGFASLLVPIALRTGKVSLVLIKDGFPPEVIALEIAYNIPRDLLLSFISQDSVALSIEGLVVLLGLMAFAVKHFLFSQPVYQTHYRSDRSRESASADLSVSAMIHVVVDDPVPPSGLIEACRKGACVFYAGSGLSAQAGFPTWAGLLEEFVHQLALAEGEKWTAMQAEISRNEVNTVMDLLEIRGKRQEFIAFARSKLDKTGRFSPPISRFLDAVPFSGVISAAFDQTLERALLKHSERSVRVRDGADFPGLLRQPEMFFLKLNDIDHDDQLTITPEQWRFVLDESPSLRTFLGSLASTRTIFFCGASLESIETFFTVLRLRLTPSIRHYALVPAQAFLDATAERLRAKFQLEIIPFSTSDSGYRHVPEFLGRLAEAAKGSVRITRSTLKPERIDRVMLTNIGPFKKAEFAFDAWTVFLGNNGCGKSTVLKSIALALCGDDERVGGLGASLLSVGEMSGSIRVRVGSIDYETKLIRERDRVIVRCSQIAPVQSGALLTLGFPAIRGASAGTIEPKYAETFAYPRVEDLLPLLQGGLDTRMNSIRQWIVNNYVRSQDTNNSSSVRQRCREMIASFFTIVDDMMPGFSIEFDSCDTKTFDVLLRTSDGIVPMEYMSQGVSSTIGWVGVLLQRLFELYDDDAAPQGQHALLIIDEIDSHLHPEWQRSLVPKLKEHFQGLQVVASTHSPLVVGSLEEGTIYAFNRAGGEVEINRVDQSFKNYRADQILTASAFGLASSRSPGWEATKQRFTALLGKSDRSMEEESEFNELSKEFGETPRSQETPIGRKAADLVDSILQDRVDALDISPEQKRQLASEAQAYLKKVSI